MTELIDLYIASELIKRSKLRNNSEIHQRIETLVDIENAEKILDKLTSKVEGWIK